MTPYVKRLVLWLVLLSVVALTLSVGQWLTAPEGYGASAWAQFLSDHGHARAASTLRASRAVAETRVISSIVNSSINTPRDRLLRSFGFLHVESARSLYATPHRMFSDDGRAILMFALATIVTYLPLAAVLAAIRVRRRKAAVLLSVCALALLVPAPSLSAGSEPNRVTLAIVLDRQTAKLGDRIVVEAQLRNMTERPVAFWGELLWGYRGGLILHVLREDGSEVPSRPRVDESIIPSQLRNRSSYVTVQPAHTFGVVRSDRVSSLVDSPGTYRIYVEYLSPLPRNYANVENLWLRDRGAIRSDEVRLVVTD